MDFENPKNWEALKREAEKAKATAEERCSQLTPDSDASMDEYAALQKDIAQYEVAIKIATLALKIAAAEPAPTGMLPVETIVRITDNRDDFKDCRGIIIYNGDWEKDSTYQVAVIGWEDSLYWYTSEEFTVISRPDTPQPAPVETPRVDNSLPKTMRTFDIGQTVCVRDDVDGEASAYTGRTGQVTHLDRSRTSGVVRYFTTLSKLDAFYADELEPAD